MEKVFSKYFIKCQIKKSLFISFIVLGFTINPVDFASNIFNIGPRQTYAYLPNSNKKH